ncbi:hypothetical protein SUGI_0721250 [Cryptomeria japonica]|nr:hypothetical protein SUGI_0721250 [Cryptomeria japonica]
MAALSLLFWGIVSLFVRSAWGGSTDVEVGLVMMQHVESGQGFKIIGNQKKLGYWIISKGLPMTYHKGDLWTASLEIDIEELNSEYDLEYKVVVVDQNYGEREVCSMPGPNRVMNIPKDFDTDSIYFIHVIWDINTCPTSCSATPACGNSSYIVNTL